MYLALAQNTSHLTQFNSFMDPQPPNNASTLSEEPKKPQTSATEPTPEPKPETQPTDDDFDIDPTKVTNKTGKDIDYSKLIVKFGCQALNPTLLERIQKLTGGQLHHYLTRDIFFSHRDFDLILKAVEQHKKGSQLPPFYLYTGRGPSSEALHLGHMLPFIFNKYLQEAFNVPLVIQITDDEKYFWKGEDEEDITDYTRLAYENIKDIIALGFDPEKTFIFIDSQYIEHMYPNVCRFQKHINMTTLKAIFGLGFSDICGKAAYPPIQAAPALSSSFKHMFGDKNIPCLIPCGIDQDPYFRMTRDVCAKLKAPKPAGIYSKFFPALQGFGTKMSGSNPISGIFMTDAPEQIQKKIKTHAFSGRGDIKQQQQKNGANLQVDVPYHYLRFFLKDDEKLEHIATEYKAGRMTTDEVKKILIEVLQQFVANHQARRKTITDQIVKQFLSLKPRKWIPK